jgi:serine/threonine protein kinase
MKPLAPNTLLQNRYLIVNLIGKGGMGEVYLAVDQRLGSAIALKRTFFSDDEMLRNAFEREARTLARLRHGVLPKVSDHFTEEETQYLIMEHISGDDLAKRLELTQKPFPLSWVLFWADQLLDALNYLHSHEPPIIHRDIKPQNLKLTDDNSIVLLDFGLSKSSTGKTKLSTTGSVVGYTPYFAPMEQVRGTGTDARSDIYSLSATFYQLLTNVVPHDALSRADALLGGLPDPLRPINELNPEVTPLVSEILLKGMEVSLEKRFPNARVMQKALREAFTQLQNGMSAKTVAFVPDDQQEVKDIPVSQLKTELMAKPPMDFHTRIQTEDSEKTEELHFGSSLTQKPTDDYSAHPQITTPPEPDFDATLVDNSPLRDLSFKQVDSPLEDLSHKQSDVKTEVFLAGSIPELTTAQEADFSPRENFDTKDEFAREDIFPQADDFESENDFAATNNFAKEENVSPFSTVPLFTVDNQEEAEEPAYAPSDSMMFDAIEPAAENFDSPTNYERAEDHSSASRVDSSSPIPPSPPQAKSNRKALIIVGVLGAFFILLVSAAGIGFYLYQNPSASTEKTTPQPTAEPTIEAATPKPTLEAVTNTNSSNDNSLNTNTDNTNNGQPETTPTVKTTETPKTVKTVEPTPAGRTTPKPTPQATTPRPTPKPPTTRATPLPRILP